MQVVILGVFLQSAGGDFGCFSPVHPLTLPNNILLLILEVEVKEILEVMDHVAAEAEVEVMIIAEVMITTEAVAEAVLSKIKIMLTHKPVTPPKHPVL